MRILVTGAAGFVGSHLIPRLAEEGHEVYALDRDKSRIADLPATPVEHDLSQRPGSLPEVDAVVHLAQANVKLPDEAPLLFAVNAGSTVDLLDHARRCGAERFLYASTGTVYGFGDEPFSETHTPAGRDLYAVSKLSGELAVDAYAPHFSTFVARLWAPYGPGQHSRMIPRLIDRVRAGELDALLGGAVSTREETDGVKVNFEDGSWILFRKSGTEPIIRIYCESPDEGRVQEMLDVAVRELG